MLVRGSADSLCVFPYATLPLYTRFARGFNVLRIGRLENGPTLCKTSKGWATRPL